MKVKAWIGLVLLTVVCAAPGQAQAPVGDEFAMSLDNDLRIWTPVAGFFESGDLVAVWERSWGGLAARAYDAQGRPHGGDLLLVPNDPVGDLPFRGVVGERSQPELVITGEESFLLFWTEETNELSVDVFYTNRNLLSREVLVQRFEEGGTPVGQPLQVSDAVGLDGRPAATRLADGSVVVTWQQLADDGWQVLGRRLDASGQPLGPVFSVGDGVRADVAAFRNGGFVVVWDGLLKGEDEAGIFGRRFGAPGAPSVEVLEISSESRYQGSAQVAVDASGQPMVVWQGLVRADGDTPRAVHVFARRLSPNGLPVGPETLVTADLPGDDHSGPALIRAADSGFFLTWMTWSSDFRVGVSGARLNAAAQLGTPLRISQNPIGLQFRLGLAADDQGRYLVAWVGYGDDDDLGVRGRLLGSQPSPAAGVCAQVGLPLDLLTSHVLCPR